MVLELLLVLFAFHVQSRYYFDLTTSYRAEPYKTTTINVTVSSCNDPAITHFYSAESASVYFYFGSARTDLLEVPYQSYSLTKPFSPDISITHEFRGTGRRNVTIVFCAGFYAFGVCTGFSVLSIVEFWVQYVRKEVRDLTSLEWSQFVDAFWIMKNTSQLELTAKYGKYCFVYDKFVVQHAKAAMNHTCDTIHFDRGFPVYHRCAFILIQGLAL